MFSIIKSSNFQEYNSDADNIDMIVNVDLLSLKFDLIVFVDFNMLKLIELSSF